MCKRLMPRAMLSLLLLSTILTACQFRPIQNLESPKVTPLEISTPNLAPATLSNLTDMAQLQEEFNARQGVPRLILLLSPT